MEKFNMLSYFMLRKKCQESRTEKLLQVAGNFSLIFLKCVRKLRVQL